MLTCVGNVRLEAGLRRALASQPQLSLKEGSLPASAPADALISVPGVGSIGFVLIVPPNLAGAGAATRASTHSAASGETLGGRLAKLITVHKYGCVILPSDMRGLVPDLPPHTNLSVICLPADQLSAQAYSSVMVGIAIALSNSLGQPGTPGAEEVETEVHLAAISPCVAELVQDAGGGGRLQRAEDAVALLDECGGSLFDLATVHPRAMAECGWADEGGWTREMHERP